MCHDKKARRAENDKVRRRDAMMYVLSENAIPLLSLEKNGWIWQNTEGRGKTVPLYTSTFSVDLVAD